MAFKNIHKNFEPDIRVKLIAVFLFIFFVVSTFKGNFQTLGLYFLSGLIMVFFFKPPFIIFLKRIFIIFLFPFSVSIFLPFTNKGNLIYSLNIYFFSLQVTDNGMAIFFTTVIKSFLSVIILAALTTSSGDLELLGGLRKIYFPAIMVSIIFLMYRYLFLIRDEAKT